MATRHAGTPSRADTARPAPSNWADSSFGDRVEHICRLRRWSIHRLAAETGVDSGVISRYAGRTEKTGGTPAVLQKIVEAANVNVAWLMFGQGPVERVPHALGELRTLPGWEAALADAQKRQRGIPDEFWLLAGQTVFPAPPRLDWQLIVGLVREMYSAHQRWNDETEPSAEPSTDPKKREA
jgi:transcriptional regulator with XRE-family HTH domain